MRAALGALAGAVEAVVGRVGAAAAWLYPALVVVLIGNVALRYGLGRGSIALEELQWHLFAAAFLLGMAWTTATDQQVRVDLLHARLSPRGRARVDFWGGLLLLVPFAAAGVVFAWDFVARSFRLGERSEMPSGLPARWVIKGVLLAGFALLLAQALAGVVKSGLASGRGREPRA